MAEGREQLTHYNTPAFSHGGDWVLVLDGIEQDQNIGGLMRSANAFGVKALWIVNTRLEALSPKALRISRLGKKGMPVRFFKDTAALLAALTESGHRLAGIELTHDAQWLPQYKKQPEKIALVLGSEKHGISQALLRACDEVIAIPLFGEVSSLNVTVAGSIAMYALATMSSGKF